MWKMPVLNNKTSFSDLNYAFYVPSQHKSTNRRKLVLAHKKFTGKLTKEQLHDLNNRERKSKVHKWREANDYFARYVRKEEKGKEMYKTILMYIQAKENIQEVQTLGNNHRMTHTSHGISDPWAKTAWAGHGWRHQVGVWWADTVVAAEGKNIALMSWQCWGVRNFNTH